jgi:hypothetical protein
MALAEMRIDRARYELHVRQEVEGWLNIKVECKKPGKQGYREKRNWWLAWNGERLARNHDAGLLAKNEPDVYQWVIDTLATYTRPQP